MAKHAVVPTLDEMAEQLRDWKNRGVTLESILWVVNEQVYFEEVSDGR